MNVSGQKGKYNNEAKVTRVRIVDTVLQYQAAHNCFKNFKTYSTPI